MANAVSKDYIGFKTIVISTARELHHTCFKMNYLYSYLDFK